MAEELRREVEEEVEEREVTGKWIFTSLIKACVDDAASETPPLPLQGGFAIYSAYRPSIALLCRIAEINIGSAEEPLPRRPRFGKLQWLVDKMLVKLPLRSDRLARPGAFIALVISSILGVRHRLTDNSTLVSPLVIDQPEAKVESLTHSRTTDGECRLG